MTINGVQSGEMFSPKRFKFTLIVALSLLTVGFFEFFPRFEPSGPELLRNGDFISGLEGWTARGGENTARTSFGTLTVENRDPSRSVDVRQVIPLAQHQGTWLLSARISTENVIPGAKSWHTARVILVGRTAAGKSLWRGVEHVLVPLAGNTAWRDFSAVFKIPDMATEVMVGMQLLRATGIMRVRNLRLTPVEQRTAFSVVASILLAAWALALAWVGKSLLSGTKFTVAHGAIGLVGLAIAAGALMPGTVKQEFLEFAWGGYEELRAALPAGLGGIEGFKWGEPEFLQVNSSQVGHFALFFVLGLVVRLARLKDPIIHQFLGLLLFGAVIEVLQYYSIGRRPTLEDWVFDAGGIILAFIVSPIFVRKAGRSPAKTFAPTGGAGGPPS